MLFVLQILVGLFTFSLISFLIGCCYLNSKKQDKNGYIYLNRRDILFMLIFFPITICFYLVYIIIGIIYKLSKNEKYKKIHKWWSKPIKRI